MFFNNRKRQKKHYARHIALETRSCSDAVKLKLTCTSKKTITVKEMKQKSVKMFLFQYVSHVIQKKCTYMYLQEINSTIFIEEACPGMALLRGTLCTRLYTLILG